MSGASVQTVRVALPSCAYDVRVGAGLLASLGEEVRDALGDKRAGGTAAPPRTGERVARRAAPPSAAPPRSGAMRAFLAHDAKLPATLVETARQSLAHAGFAVVDAAVEASEEHKSLDAVARLLEAMAAAKLERSEPVVAMGGGVVGDVAAFAASVYRRGVPVMQCPTTLLAMVDASVGGKTGVNLRVGGQLRKNMAGTFWQPALVLCDVAALDSLPERHLRAGFAECIKHALLAASTPARDDELFDWTLDILPRALARERDALTALIARNVAVKARVVEHDEREQARDDVGGRALLNLGHTFAHAIETLSGLSAVPNQKKTPPLNPLPQAERAGTTAHLQPTSREESGEEKLLLHGEAVGLGLIAATATAASLQLIPCDLEQGVRAAVAQAGLPQRVAGLPSDEALINAMAHDKKQQAGVMRLVLPTGAGRCAVVASPSVSAVCAGWRAIRADPPR